MNPQDRIECVDCNGEHKGTVVAVIRSDVEYGVAWDARNPNWGKPGNTEPQFPAEFVKQHKHHISFTMALAIRPISK